MISYQDKHFGTVLSDSEKNRTKLTLAAKNKILRSLPIRLFSARDHHFRGNCYCRFGIFMSRLEVWFGPLNQNPFLKITDYIYIFECGLIKYKLSNEMIKILAGDEDY